MRGCAVAADRYRRACAAPTDPLEQAGIERTLQQLRAGRPGAASPRCLAPRAGRAEPGARATVPLAEQDRPRRAPGLERRARRVRLSCLEGRGLPELEAAIERAVLGGEGARRDWSLAINARHQHYLAEALAFLAGRRARAGGRALAGIRGRRAARAPSAPSATSWAGWIPKTCSGKSSAPSASGNSNRPRPPIRFCFPSCRSPIRPARMTLYRSPPPVPLFAGPGKRAPSRPRLARRRGAAPAALPAAARRRAWSARSSASASPIRSASPPASTKTAWRCGRGRRSGSALRRSARSPRGRSRETRSRASFASQISAR